MTRLMRRKPFGKLISWRPFSPLWVRGFEDFWGSSWVEIEDVGRWYPHVESYQKNGSYVIKADLAGVKAKDIQVMVEGDSLIIQGERKMDRETKKRDFRKREVFYGTFQRSVPMPPGLSANDIKAKYHDGVLEISAHVKKGHLPKEVKVEEKTA
ncbi:MAG: Hsp20/alpha crystallin family protein [Rubrivivax sp.]|nr:Hsp20/alpha crystallin family protein [Rubrivivax sp.]